MATLKFLSTQADKDTKINMDSLETSIITNANNYTRWLDYLTTEALVLKKATQKMDTLYSARYRYYRWEGEADLVKGEIPVLIKGEAKYQELASVVEIQRQKINLIEGTLKAINSLGFNIKTLVEWEKIKQGF